MKFDTFGGLKNLVNIGNYKASAAMKVGMGVTVNHSTKAVSLPADTAACKAVHYVVSNINDEAEVGSYSDYLSIASGDYVRIDDLDSANDRKVEIAASEITTAYASLSAGTTLVFGTDGKLVAETTLTGYHIYFTVLEKTAYRDQGVLALVTVA